MKKSLCAVALAGTLGLAATAHTDHVIVTVAGKELDIGEDGLATAVALNTPRGIGIDAANNIYIAEFGNNRIRKVAVGSNILTTETGNGVAAAMGDLGPASEASINGPRDVSVDEWGDIWVSEFSGHSVRRIRASDHVIETIAGNGIAGFSGDLDDATLARINTPRSVVVGNDHSVYIADSGNGRVRVVGSDGKIATLVGKGGSTLDDIPVGDASPQAAIGLAFDGAGNLFVAGGGKIRKVAAGRITTVAGTGAVGSADGRATSGTLNGAGQP